MREATGPACQTGPMTGDAHLPHPGAPLTLGAVVLAGGGGARMGGVDKASIEVDGVNLRDLDVGAWRSRVTAVFQDFIRFELPVRDNVAPSGAPDDVVLAALEEAGKVTYASNVSEVATQVNEGAVDCGIIYATDANTYELTVVDRATEDLSGKVIYPAAVMKCGTEAGMTAAQDFLDYLRTSDDAHGVLEDVGFTVLE